MAEPLGDPHPELRLTRALAAAAATAVAVTAVAGGVSPAAMTQAAGPPIWEEMGGMAAGSLEGMT